MSIGDEPFLGSVHKPVTTTGREPGLGGVRRANVDPQRLADLLGHSGERVWRESVDYVLDKGQTRGYALTLVAVLAEVQHRRESGYTSEHRIAATRALQAFGDEVATQALVDLLADRTEWWLGQYAKDALVAISNPAVPLVLKALSHYDPIARRRAALILGEIGDRLALQPLVTLLYDDPVPWVRACAAKGLETFIYSADARGALLQAVNDKDDLVRRYAHEVLATG